MKNEIVLYQSDELTSRIEVRMDEETVWLNRHQIAILFGRDVKTIGKHISNVFKEGELDKKVVVANFATTTQHGAIKGIITVAYGTPRKKTIMDLGIISKQSSTL